MRFTTCFLLLLLSQSLFAQTIQGIILDDKGAPAPFATIRLLKAADSSLVAAAYAQEQGDYKFPSQPAGTYFLQAGLIGFDDTFSKPFELRSESYHAQTIQLSAKTLKEVSVSGRRRLIENQADKTILHVEGTALSAGNSALELLQRSPGVVVTPQDAIKLYGKGGTLVLIDGRSLQMNEQELAAYLKALPAENIKSIELIAHPSARYDAQGVAGIINIRMRKNQNLGWNGNLSAGNTQGVHHRLRSGINLNYRPGKVNFFGNYSLIDALQSVDQTIDRSTGELVFSQSNPKLDDWTSHNYKAGADWAIHERHSAGFMLNGSRYNNLTESTNTTLISTRGNPATDSSLLGSFRNPENNSRLNYNFNYRWADTSGNEWTFEADRIDFRMRGSNALQNDRYNAAQIRTGAVAIQSDMSNEVTVWSLKTDGVKNLKNGLRIESGAKMTWTSSRNTILSASGSDGGALNPDASRSNRVHFEEQIGALYTTLHRTFKKWDLQAGLRAENTQLEGVSTDLAAISTLIRKTHYLDLFPSVFVQYKINDAGNSWGFAAGRRIERPAYQDLNPFIWQLDPYTSERGNPNLKPAYVQSAELKFNYHWAASLALGYARTSDAVSKVARIDGEQAFVQPDNLATQDNISLNFNVPTPISKWWDGYLWLGVWNNHFRSDLPEGRLDTYAWGGGAWIGQQIKLPKQTQFEFSCWAQFPGLEGVIRNKGIWSLDLGLKKQILHNKATVKINLYDVFHTQHWTDQVNFGGLQSTIRNHWESQAFAINLNWKFGNQNLKTRERKSGADGENSRIKGGKNG